MMVSKKAAHACLKGSEAVNTPAMLEEGRRDGETLFDPQASVQMQADEWDRIWQCDEAELPRLHQALHACRAEAEEPEHARPPISDGAPARAVGLLRNKRGIGTDHWTPLELKALPDAATASLAFIVGQIDARLTIPLQCLPNLTGERPIVLQSLLHVLWSSCRADAIRAWEVLGLCGQMVQCFEVRNPQEAPAGSGCHFV